MSNEILNSRDSVLRRLAVGPLSLDELTSSGAAYAIRELVRLQRSGLVTNFYRCAGRKKIMTYRLKEKTQ